MVELSSFISCTGKREMGIDGINFPGSLKKKKDKHWILSREVSGFLPPLYLTGWEIFPFASVDDTFVNKSEMKLFESESFVFRGLTTHNLVINMWIN